VPNNHNPFSKLHIKLSRTSKALKRWSKSIISQRQLAPEVCREVIEKLEQAQKNRQLTEEERRLIKDLKFRILGLSTVKKEQSKTKVQINLAQIRRCQHQVFPPYGKC
jgi:DICT domain-containing protein